MATIPHPEIKTETMVAPSEPMKRWTVDEYHELIRLGLLTEEDPFELIEGWLVTKTTRNPPHDFVVSYLSQLLVKALPRSRCCRTQCAITLGDGEPEPDIAVVAGTQVDYRTKHPYADQVALIVEVSDRTLRRDRGMKLRSYARAGIAEYWVVNLKDQQVEVYTQPDASQPEPAYGSCQVYKKGDTISLKVDGKACCTVAVDEIC